VNEVIPEPSLTMVLRKYRQAIEENTVVHWEETSDYPAGRLTGEASHFLAVFHTFVARTSARPPEGESGTRSCVRQRQ